MATASTDPERNASALTWAQKSVALEERLLAKEPDNTLRMYNTANAYGAIELIHSELLKLRNAGVSILLISSELDELIALSDRISVFFAGKISQNFRRESFDANEIGVAMTGALH